MSKCVGLDVDVELDVGDELAVDVELDAGVEPDVGVELDAGVEPDVGVDLSEFVIISHSPARLTVGPNPFSIQNQRVALSLINE